MLVLLKKFGLKTKFRTLPGCLGNYEIMGKNHSIAEIEEIITKNTKDKPRSFFDSIDNWAKEQGASGLAYFSLTKSRNCGVLIGH